MHAKPDAGQRDRDQEEARDGDQRPAKHTLQPIRQGEIGDRAVEERRGEDMARGEAARAIEASAPFHQLRVWTGPVDQPLKPHFKYAHRHEPEGQDHRLAPIAGDPEDQRRDGAQDENNLSLRDRSNAIGERLTRKWLVL